MVVHGWELLTSAVHEGEFVFAAKNLPMARSAPALWIADLWSALNRGLPKRLSPLLRDRFLSRYTLDELMEALERPYFFAPTTSQWDEIILGESEKKNPAREFFKNDIPKLFGDYPYLQHLMLPECPFALLGANFLSDEPINEKECVDFYIPSARTVIEIDGIQHKEEGHAASDKVRDEVLNKRKISVVRISTADLRSRGAEFEVQIKHLRSIFQQSKELNGAWKSSDSVKYHAPSRASAELILVERFQQIIIQLLARGAISTDVAWKFGIKTKLKDLSWAYDAAEDLLNLIEHLCVLRDVPYSRPAVEIDFASSSEVRTSDTTLIDIAFDEWLDGSKVDPRWIVVRNSQLQTYSYQTQKGLNIPLVIQSEPILANRDSPPPKFQTLSENQVRSLTALTGAFFGYFSLRMGQAEIMGSAISQQKTLGLMPTGAGKSLCFQVPTAIQHGCAIVVCPITALIRDHVAELDDFGFRRRAYAISAETPQYEREFILERLVRGQLKFLFLSPEQLQKLYVRERIAATNAAGHLSYIVIDEVHCVSEWGHDFRTSYLTLAKTLERYAPGVRLICLTATASVRVMNDVKTEFSIPDESICYFMQRSRQELVFKVIKTDDKLSELRNCLTSNSSFIPSSDNAFLVFSPTVDGPTGVANLLSLVRKWLSRSDIFLFSGKDPNKDFFSLETENLELAKLDNNHAKNFSDYKRLVQRLFKANKISGIVATKSFGMGVNKPNIRTTFHCGLPSSMEALYQEAGRAGRDGKSSTCITIFKADAKIPERILDPRTDAITLKRWCGQQGWTAGDFSSQMKLFTRELRSVAEDVIACEIALKDLRANKSGSVLLQGHSEKILYRLHQLGFIKDWTVEKFFRGQYRVEWIDQTPHQIASNIYSYISKYELSEEKRDGTKDRLFNIADRYMKDQAEEELITELLQWIYDNFFYQRRQSLKTLFDECLNFNDRDPDQFRRNIELYFQLNEDRYLIQDTVGANADEAPRLVRQLITEPNGKLKTTLKLEELSGSVLRFLESYPSNAGLDLLSATCRSLNNDFENADGRPRMEHFLSVLRMSKAFDVGWENLLSLLTVIPQVAREPLIESVVTSYQEPAYSVQLFELFNSDVALESCARNMNSRVNKLIGV